MLSVVVLVAVILNGMALRACAMSRLVVGTNCHEAKQPTNCEGHSDRSCICEKPASVAQRADVTDMDLPVLAPSTPLPFLVPIAIRDFEAHSRFISDGSPPVSYCMPLLF